MEKYESIINMPYQKSTKRKHMSLNDRAAQFAPFAALTGYEESIKEVSRTTDKKIRLSKEEKEVLVICPGGKESCLHTAAVTLPARRSSRSSFFRVPDGHFSSVSV